MSSTTEIGDRFRDAVAALLRTQYPDTKTEQFIAGTKVDITFTQREWTKAMFCSVECKNYDGPLTKSDLEKIFGKYHPMFEGRLVQRVIVVSRHPLGAAAEGYFGAMPAYSHLTFEGLAEHLFDVRRMVEQLSDRQQSKPNRYIEARFEETSVPAFGAVESWIAAPDSPAMAVLGGYGQGKTSLAEEIAARAADRYLADPGNRIPLLLRLGEVVHETQLEGLFGKEFTAKYSVPRYQFATLMHLNQLGRLLIILDGFDEMKHAMSAHDFEANFKEFNRLLVGDAKVMLLGRPSALPSESRELVFRGRKKVGQATIQSPHFKPWIERRLAFFSAAESHQLLTHELSSDGGDASNEAVRRRVDEIERHVPLDLLRRPVHVKLIAEVAGDPGFDFKGFDEHTLYAHFVREMIKRDQVDKPARRDISLEDRLKFQRELAWWAWARPAVNQGSFYRDELPQDVLDTVPDGESSDTDSKRNEYIVSTLTDEKEAGILYFSHRSFQEFLVAERMTLVMGPTWHAAYSHALNEEIGNFVGMTPDQSFLEKWYATLNADAGPLSLDYLALYSRSESFVERVWDRIDREQAVPASTLVILLLAFTMRGVPPASDEVYRRLLRDEIEAGSETSAAVAVLSLISLYDSEQGEILRTSELVSSIFLRAVNLDAATRVPGAPPGPELLIGTKGLDFAVQWIERLVLELRKADRVLVWQTGTLQLLARTHLHSRFLASDGHDDGWKRIPRVLDDRPTRRVELPMATVNRQIPEAARLAYGKFLSAPSGNFKIVATERRGSTTGRRKTPPRYSSKTDSQRR